MAGFAGVIDDTILPPAGVELRSDKEHLILSQVTRARAKEDWHDVDLILLAKIVKMEADIRAAQVEQDAVGMLGRKNEVHKYQSPDLCGRHLGATSACYDPIHVTEPTSARTANNHRHR